MGRGNELAVTHRFRRLSPPPHLPLTLFLMQLRGPSLVLETVSARQPVISGSGATRTLNATESGSVCLFDRAAGIVYTLPTGATPGTYFDFHVVTTITSNAAKVITGAGTELLIGGLLNVDTDSSNAVAIWTGNGSTHVSVSMNGTTTGGIAGTYMRFTCLSSTRWMVQGFVEGSGVVATPFATS